MGAFLDSIIRSSPFIIMGLLILALIMFARREAEKINANPKKIRLSKEQKALRKMGANI